MSPKSKNGSLIIFSCKWNEVVYNGSSTAKCFNFLPYLDSRMPYSKTCVYNWFGQDFFCFPSKTADIRNISYNATLDKILQTNLQN